MKAYIIPETSTIKIVLAALCGTLCGMVIGAAGMVVYDAWSTNMIAKVCSYEARLAHLEGAARPMNNNFDSTVNYFLNGEKEE